MHAALALVAVVATAATPQTWSFKTGPMPYVTIENPRGAVVVQRTDAQEVTVEARIDKTPSACTRYEVQVTNRDGHVDAKAVCSPCDPSITDCAQDFKINMVVHVPKRAKLVVQDSAPALRQM